MATSDLESYKQYVNNELSRLSDIIYQYADGEFSGMLSITEEENEFTDLHRALNYLADRLSEKESKKDTHTACEELDKYKDLLARTQELAHLGSWELYHASNELIWSDEVFRIFGLKPQEYRMTYEMFLDMVHPEDRQAVTYAFENSLAQGQDEYETEHRIIRKQTEEIRYLHEKCKHIRDEAGNIIKSTGMVHDITDRKHAEQRLENVNHVMRAVLDVNQLIIREKNPDKLISEATSLLTETRGYLNVWITLFDEDGNVGKIEGNKMSRSFSSLKKEIMDGKRVHCQKMAIQKKNTLLIDDPFQTCEDCPLSQEYEGRAALVSPLEHHGVVYGTITASIPAEMAGDEKERALFDELAGDIGYALYTIKLEEKKRNAEKKRDEYQKQLINTLHSVDSLLVVIDSNHRIILSNWKDHEWVPEEKREKRPYCYKALKNYDSPCEYCPPSRTFKDGEYRWYEDQNPIDGSYKEISVVPLFSEDGNVQYVLENVKDVTERREAEEKIKKSETELGAIYENAPFIMMLLDRERRIRKINRFGEKFAGSSSEKLIGLRGGQALRCVHHFDDPRGCGYGAFCKKCPVSNAVLDTFSTGRSYEGIEGSIPFLISGEEKELTLLISTSLIDMGREPLVLVSILDITERKKAEKILAEREKKYRKIFNNTNDAMYLHKVTDEGQFGNFFEVNDVACDMLGYSRAELMNMSPHEIDDPEYAYSVPDLKEQLNKQGSVTFEMRHITKNGSRIPVEISAHLFTLNNESLVLSTARNITERKQAEENIYRSLEKEKELNQMKLNFISMVSHEFRTPLANIYSNTQLLQRYRDNLNDEKKDRYLERIQDSVNILRNLLDNVSFFSKKENNRLNLQPEQIEINNYFQSIIDEVLAHFKNKNTILFYNENKTGYVIIDKFLLRYVVSNLLSNAMKYSGSDVECHVSYLPDNKLNIIIKDWGKGIPQKDLEHIFEPFVRSDNTDNSSGTGLGLAIVKHCLDLLKGKIDISSKIGKGTKVAVEVPYQKTEN
jgi:PAS domain S-box-containing protein